MSSFNDEDYEVDENSDEEEQEEPGDYCKGTLANLSECNKWRLQFGSGFTIPFVFYTQGQRSKPG